MKKKIILMLVCAFFLSFSGNIYALEVSTSEDVENVENFVETVERGFRKCAENDEYILEIEENSGILALKNKSTNYIWYSSPIDAETDTTASELIKNELLSSNMLRYGIPSKRTNNNLLRSNTGDCTFTISDISGGVRIMYNYKAGFRFPVDYVLESDYLRASLRISEIEESNPDNTATEITMLGNFGASSGDGYFVIPDGSGALIRFNSNRTADTNAYSRNIYGNDITAVPTSAPAPSEQIYLPMFGIVRDDNAMLVVADKGDSNAYITAKISGQSNSNYNICRFTFTLRNTDTFYMSGSNNDKFTVFETGGIKSDDIEVRYYPIDSGSYIDIAGKYREYLSISPKEKESALYVNLYGGTEKKKNVFGIPVTMKQSATDYMQAREILTELKNKGAENIVVSYSNWTDNGMKNKIDTGANPSDMLGGRYDFNKLMEFIKANDFSLYPSTHNRDFVSGNGYSSLNSTCIRVSGAYSRVVSYDRAYGIPDGFAKNMSLLSPSHFAKVYTDTAKSFINHGFSGIFPQHLTTSLYGDYSRNKISRFNAMEHTEDALETLSENLSILTDNTNAYALPYVSHITNMPINSSRFDIFSEDIPFIEIVLHGVIPYATNINSSANPTETLLKAVSVGSLPCYDLLYEPTSELKDTALDVYYYANYRGWLDDIAEKYEKLKPLYDDIADSTITSYTTEKNIITTTYSNGTKTITDTDNMTINFNGNIIEVRK